ncbi:MAG: ATP-dependent RNA helicase HrpA, partial [Pseudomonadota bacterium]|nr:ATP-dependent RNA helicase HrpA [Pseudomonadota bacterium]
WHFFTENRRHLSNNKLRKSCREHFLSYLRLWEWQDIHQQLYTAIRDTGWNVNQIEANYEAIHQALLTGLLGNIGFKTEAEQYLGARNIKLYLFPGSGLFKKQPKWMMAAELVETTRLYARCVAKIQPEWVEQAAQHLCQQHYFEPHWEKRTAQVAAYEKVTLYGLTLVAKRKINYGPIDPQVARSIFIRQALVEGDYQSNAAFLKHNQALIQEIEHLEHKARRQDILIDDEQMYQFYDARIPEAIYNGKSFEHWRLQAERHDPQILFLSRDELMRQSAANITPHAFPDHIVINEVVLTLSYQFEPGREDDGVSVDLPLALLNQLSPQPFEWLVPGLLEEKIIALLRSLPKTLRKAFVPVPDVARHALAELPAPRVTFNAEGSFLEVPMESLHALLNRYCHRRLGKPMPAWQLTSLPEHLLMNFRLLDNHKQFLAMGRDLSALQQHWGQHASNECSQEVAKDSGLERDHLTRWDFGELPEQVNLTINGVKVQGFPTLIDQQDQVALRILDNEQAAQQQFRLGLRRLFLFALPTKKLLKQMPIPHQLCLQYMKVGPCEHLKTDLLSTLIDAALLTEPLPRTQSAFEQRLAQGKQQILPLASEYVAQLAQVLTEYHQLTTELRAARAHPALPEIKQHLAQLIYEGFVQHTPLAQLKHLPRYLKASRIRLQRLQHDPHKDEQKARQIKPLWEAYWQHHDPAALTEFRWMLEELRVSLFAQELKTPYPVSLQRLEKVWQQLQ